MPQQPTTDATFLGGLCPAGTPTGLGELGCLLAEWEVLTLAVAALVVVLAVVGLIRARRRRPGAGGNPGSPFLVFPMEGQGRAARARTRDADPTPSPEEPTRTASAPRESLRPEGWGPEPAPSTAEPPPGPALRQALAPAPEPPNRPPVGSERVESGTISYERPPDGTLQLLPGRLEVLANGRGQTGGEIRFVRVPGQEPEVTFGRTEGIPYRHIQLQSPTVSRMHARMRFSNGRWTLFNESATNPTLLNGIPLDPGVESPALRNDDRIEMGEVVFRFQQPETRDRLPFRSSWYTDQGRRANNQDAVMVKTLPRGKELAVVCDGMGSHRDGRLASHTALESMVKALVSGQSLHGAVQAANRDVREKLDVHEDGLGMGTTLVALLRTGEEYQVANVGDSRAYRIDARGIHRITQDHSFVAEVVREGRMSADEAGRSPWRSAITRHLGAEPEVEADLFGAYPADEPHVIILCSDGLHGVLDDDAIRARVVATSDIRDVARELAEEALRRGGDDNVTVAALDFAGGLEQLRETHS